jgi:hypothetical protein
MDGEVEATVNLCVYSRAAGRGYVDRTGRWDGVMYEHLEECPLGLSRKEASHCPCKQYVVAGEVRTGDKQYRDVKVTACVFPLMWNGTPIRNPEAFARHIKQKS